MFCLKKMRLFEKPNKELIKSDWEVSEGVKDTFIHLRELWIEMCGTKAVSL